MKTILSLNGSDWVFKDFLGEDWVWRNAEKPDTRDVRWWRNGGTVPGSVHHDLWTLGEIPDPYFERNSLLIEWVPERTWVYKKTFQVDPGWAGKRVRLHFEGVDYEALFFLNGKPIGKHKGMYTPAVFEVADKLMYGEDNLLAVVISRAPDEEPQVSKTSYVRTHKSRMTYWWDFCPRMIHIGIWDDVRLEATGPVCVEDAFVHPVLADDRQSAELSVSVKLSSTVRTPVELETEILLDGRQVAIHRSRHAVVPGELTTNAAIPLEAPKLWWPNGYGEQPLYEARVRLVLPDEDAAGDAISGQAVAGSARVSDERTVTFGIRKIEVVRNETPDATALPYTFVVNGRQIYIKGWNWVPIDVMYGVERPAKLNRLLTLARRANVNMLRVWGGGLIEKEAFYELCDKNGILVWQEFIQSSSGIDNKPSTDPAFIDMMVQEAERIIPRKRNHPSLALWCGGNELQDLNEKPLGDREPVLAALKDAVHRLDPDRYWLATSPTGPVFSNSVQTIEADPNSLHDVHGPWEHQGLTEQYTLYNMGSSLLHSEFGVEGMTHLRTLNATIGESNQWPPSRDNPVYFHRGSWWINEPLVQRSFDNTITDIAVMIRASQLLQAEGLRYAVESNRRRKYQNSGTLPWQFNEPYPNAYCTSALDYYAVPKPAYYAVARAYRPVTVNASFPTQSWAGRDWFEAAVYVSNSHETGMEGCMLRTRLTGQTGQAFDSTETKIAYAGNRSTQVHRVELPMAQIADDVFFLDLELLDAEGKLLARNRYPFVKTESLLPMLQAPEAELEARCTEVSGDNEISGEAVRWVLEIRNLSSTAALFVWLEDDRNVNADGHAYFEDNHFTLLPDETRIVNVDWQDVPAGERRLLVQGWNTKPRTIAGSDA